MSMSTNKREQCDPVLDEVLVELLALVDQGLLQMGVREDGEAVFWATDKGVDVLGIADNASAS